MERQLVVHTTLEDPMEETTNLLPREEWHHGITEGRRAGIVVCEIQLDTCCVDLNRGFLFIDPDMNLQFQK